ncbi:MAG TPA: glycoside hydrolase, partial [Armatimonadota bacterium]
YPPAEYEKDDWRDPYVFFHEPTGEFWMLVTTRKASGPTLHRGCIALVTSRNLEHWEVQTPIWDPEEQYAHECPDLFRIGDWWYLISSSSGQTRYRMSRSPKGPWLAPESDALDGRAYYAGKTAGDGQRRYLFGWLPTRAEEKDTGRWQWGGNIVVHELKQQPDGALSARPPTAILNAFSQPTLLTPWSVLGEWVVEEDLIATYALGRFSALTLGGLPKEGLFQTRITYGPGTKSCGLLLHASENFYYYQLVLEPAYQRMAITRRPGGQPVILERPLPMQPGKPITLKVIVDGSCMVIYADDQVALSFRGYDFRKGLAGVFVQEGEASFTDFSIMTRPK